MTMKGNKGKAAMKFANFPKMAKFLKKKKKCRFSPPLSLECEGCHCSIANGVEVYVTKQLEGKHHAQKLWRYNFKCPCCRHKIVMRMTSKGLDVIEGAEDKWKTKVAGRFDWNEWKKERSKQFLDTIDPSLSKRYNIFDTFHFAMVIGDPRGDGPLYGV